MIEQCGAIGRQIWRRIASESKATELIENILGSLDQFCTLLDQGMTTLALRRMDRAGDGEYVSALFRGQPRGDQRTALQVGFHHEATNAHAADEAVAAREVGG